MRERVALSTISIIPSILDLHELPVNYAFMTKKKLIPIVDLFAGPGGLGEGFSSLTSDTFRILVSAEMEASAHKTLRLRAFYRLLRRRGGNALNSYYSYCNGITDEPFDQSNKDAWDEACKEAQSLTLGTPDHDIKLDEIIRTHKLGAESNWLLIGGPPCQAYSLVGRSRNQGKLDYKAENDHRHFLYREYLKIIQKYRPAIFVMENVKGILSASVGGQKIFHTILRDLVDPDKAVAPTLAQLASRTGYRIHSLVKPIFFDRWMETDEIDPRDFIIRSEKFGVPQARHRVILLGVRDDLDFVPSQLEMSASCSVEEAIGKLPKLRSRLSKQVDASDTWAYTVRKHFGELAKEAYKNESMSKLGQILDHYSYKINADLPHGALRLPRTVREPQILSELEKWYEDNKLTAWLNHESRGHMSSDLRRYAFAASFAESANRSPKGHSDFSLKGLRPDHENWESGKFSDRFRVQLKHLPSTTITSHISKDGHYFIHYDPAQCRSLTVREAARLQTFPDNYFFEGNRTQQLTQVGNAVPPLLAKKIAEIVSSMMEDTK